MNYRSIGNRIKTTRKMRGLTQEFLARKANVNTSHISNIENNRTKVSLATLIKICNCLGVTVDYILSSNYPGAQSSIDEQILLELQHCSDHDKEQILKIVRAFGLKEHDTV